MTYPLAIAPTNTAIECVCGRVGRYEESRTVGESPERAVQGIGITNVMGEGRARTEFKGVGGEMISDGVL